MLNYYRCDYVNDNVIKNNFIVAIIIIIISFENFSMTLVCVSGDYYRVLNRVGSQMRLGC